MLGMKQEFFMAGRETFAFLAEAHGFDQCQVNEGDEGTPCSITFANRTTEIFLERKSWGTGVTAWIGPKGAARDETFGMVPIWALATLMKPAWSIRLAMGGQLHQVRCSAAFLRDECQPILAGDFAVLEPVRNFLKARQPTRSKGLRALLKAFRRRH